LERTDLRQPGQAFDLGLAKLRERELMDVIDARHRLDLSGDRSARRIAAAWASLRSSPHRGSAVNPGSAPDAMSPVQPGKLLPLLRLGDGLRVYRLPNRLRRRDGCPSRGRRKKATEDLPGLVNVVRMSQSCMSVTSLGSQPKTPGGSASMIDALCRRLRTLVSRPHPGGTTARSPARLRPRLRVEGLEGRTLLATIT